MKDLPASVLLKAMLKLKSPSKSPKKIPRHGKESRSHLRQRIDEIFSRLAAQNPDPKCELYFKTPYQLLVSVVLSAQTTDKMVNRCMTPVYDQGFTPDVAVRLGADGILPLIRSIGFAPTKSKNIVKLSQILIDRFSGEIPRDRTSLEALPGVGKKTASVVLAELWNEPVLAVDTHVFRVGKRLGFHDEPTPEKAATRLMDVIDRRFLPKAHHWLILHGRYTCKALRPLCSQCVLNSLCPSRL